MAPRPAAAAAEEKEEVEEEEGEGEGRAIPEGERACLPRWSLGCWRRTAMR